MDIHVNEHWASVSKNAKSFDMFFCWLLEFDMGRFKYEVLPVFVAYNVMLIWVCLLFWEASLSPG